MAHFASESVAEPCEEPTGIESLEWLFALEHNGSEEEIASITETANPVRLLLDSGSGVSACSLEFGRLVEQSQVTESEGDGRAGSY